MQPDSFFALNSYHIALVVVGAIVIVAQWLPRLFSDREPASAPLMILFGTGAARFEEEFRCELIAAFRAESRIIFQVIEPRAAFGTVALGA